MKHFKVAWLERHEETYEAESEEQIAAASVPPTQGLPRRWTVPNSILLSIEEVPNESSATGG